MLKYRTSFQVIVEVIMLVGVACDFSQISAKFNLSKYFSRVLYLSEYIDIN